MIPNADRQIVEMLVATGSISEDDLERILKTSSREGIHLREALLDVLDIDIFDYMNFLSRQSGVPPVDFTVIPSGPSKEALHIVPEQFARMYNILPLSVSGRYLVVAITDPSQYEWVKFLGVHTRKKIARRISYQTDIDTAIDAAYSGKWSAYMWELANGRLTKHYAINSLYGAVFENDRLQDGVGDTCNITQFNPPQRELRIGIN